MCNDGITNWLRCLGCDSLNDRLQPKSIAIHPGGAADGQGCSSLARRMPTACDMYADHPTAQGALVRVSNGLGCEPPNTLGAIPSFTTPVYGYFYCLLFCRRRQDQGLDSTTFQVGLFLASKKDIRRRLHVPPRARARALAL